MDRELIIRLAVQAGITPWAKNEWSKDRFVQTDEGMDGDAACLIQFAALIAAHEREACAKVCENLEMRNDCYDGTGNYVAGWSDGTDDCAAAIRSRT